MGVCNGQTDFGLTLTIWPEKEIYGRHTFVLFVSGVEGEENKLTTFSTWTIMLGCNESNIIFQQHLTSIRSSNEEETSWLHFRTFCELVEGEENKLTTFSTWTI